MFSYEEGASEIVDKAIDKYELHFEIEFPVFEYTEITSGKGYDFSVEGANKLIEFIDERIEKGQPVDLPPDYVVRFY